jgi:uroporphyrin-3 C-methyltransferase
MSTSAENESLNAPAALPPSHRASAPHWVLWLTGIVAGLALALALLLWVRESIVSDQQTRQAAAALSTAAEARALALQSQTREQDLTSRLAVLDARLADTALQRNQLDALMQSLARSRDEFLVADIETTLRLADEHTQLSGSAQPLLEALRGLQRRLQAVAESGGNGSARLAAVRKAVAQDAAHIAANHYLDTPALLAQLGELMRMAQDAPLSNGYANGQDAAQPQAKTANAPTAPNQEQNLSRLSLWWQRQWTHIWQVLQGLVRVSRIDAPEAALLAPEQSFYLRENLQLLLLNARQALLGRQPEAARMDLLHAESLLKRYFRPEAEATKLAQAALHDIQLELQNPKLPRADATLAALAALAAMSPLDAK